MCHVIHIYRRISVVPYQSVIPNSHQVPCNGFMLVAASQPAMQPNTDTHYQSLSVRSPYSSHAIVSSAEMSTWCQSWFPPRCQQWFQHMQHHTLPVGSRHVRCARADPALQCSSISCSYPVISVINIFSTVPHCSGSYFLFVVRTWYVPVPGTPWNLVPLGYVTNIAYNTMLLWWRCSHIRDISFKDIYVVIII